MIGEALVAFKVASGVLGATAPVASIPLSGVLPIMSIMALTTISREVKEQKIVTVCKVSEMNKQKKG